VKRLPLFLVAAALISTGCTNAPATLNLMETAPSPSTRAVSHQIANDKPSIRLRPSVDMRPADTGLGNVAGRPFAAENLMPWIDRELAKLAAQTANIIADTSEAPDTTGSEIITVHPRLLKVYVDSVSVARTAVVVLQIDYTTSAGVTETKIFRGQFAGANWASGDNEVKSALKRAFFSCAQKWTDDLKARLSTSQKG
jgi:hypothetical protein